MRVTLDLDDHLIRALMERHPGAPMTEAVERAIRAYVATDTVSHFRDLVGTVEVEESYREMRRADQERQERLRRIGTDDEG